MRIDVIYKDTVGNIGRNFLLRLYSYSNYIHLYLLIYKHVFDTAVPKKPSVMETVDKHQIGRFFCVAFL